MQKYWNHRALAALAAAIAVFAYCKHQNRPPETPPTPAGPSSVLPDSAYTFTTSSVDPDGDSVSCRFDWGDSTFSVWSPYVPSGTVVSATKTWARHGAFRVRALAEDRHGAQSDWSPQLMVAVANGAPEIPRVPYGPDTGTAPVLCEYGTVTSDANLDAISYQFDWGNGDTTAWSTPVSSGYAVYMTDTCISGGEYLLRARARDTLGAISEWSAPRLLRISGPTVPWRFATAGYERYASPAIGPDGTVYLAEQSGAVRAVNPDGSLKWQLRIPGVIDAPPTVAGDGTVYLSGGSYLYSIRPDGNLNYRLSRGHVNSYGAISVVGDSILYYPNPRLLALSRDGTIRWINRLGTSPSSQVIAADGTTYFQAHESLFALNADGSLRWAVGFSFGNHYSPPTLGTNGMVYCAGDDGTLSAYDSSGNPAWTCELDGRQRRIYAAPAIGDDGVLYCGFDQGLCAVTSSGTKAWTFETVHDVRTTPAIAADGTIYFGCEDHYLYALNRDSTLKWRYHIGRGVRSSPVIGQDGRVYVASYDGYLYAIEGGSPPAQSPWPMYLHDARHTGWAGTR